MDNVDSQNHSILDDSEALQEYHSLDKQLDQLADYLTVMEGRSDRLAEEARQLLQEAREARTVATSNGVESTQNRRNQS